MDIVTGKILKNCRIPELDSHVTSCSSVGDGATILLLSSRNELAWFNYMNNSLLGYKPQQGKKSN